MKLITKSLLFVGFICLLASCSTDEVNETNEIANLENEITVENNNAFSQEIFLLVNAHRETLDLPPFSNHNLAKEEAINHTGYMIINNKVSHDNFFERSEYLKANGADAVSENVAYGYRTAQSVLEGWLNSDSHREAIEGDFTHTGISVAQTENGINYFTHIFLK